MTVRPMRPDDLGAVVALQPLAFPPPFPAGLLWDRPALAGLLTAFPEGQFVAEAGGEVVGSCSNVRLAEAIWRAPGPHAEWIVGSVERHDPAGTTLFGLDISVHPDRRRAGVGRALYAARFDLVRTLGLARYGTACRLPNRGAYPDLKTAEYVRLVAGGGLNDRTLSPLLRLGLSLVGTIEGYMDDPESLDAAAVLERAS